MPLWCCPPQTPGPDPAVLQIRFVPGADGPVNRSGGGRGSPEAQGQPPGADTSPGAPSRGWVRVGGTKRFAALGRGRGGSSPCPLGPTEPSAGGDPGVHSIPVALLRPQGVPKPLEGRAGGGKLSTGVTTTSKPRGRAHPMHPPCPMQPCVPFPKQPQGGPGVGWVPAPVWGLVSHPKRNQTPSRTGERTRQSPAQHNLGFPAPRGSCCTRREPPGWGETGTFEDSQALEQLPEHLTTGEGIACPAGSQKYPKPDPRDWGTLPEDPPVVGWLRTRVGHERPG